jgi:CheY-like chemotaxis protein
MQVLIIDDDPDDLIIFDHIVTMVLGHQVTRATDGVEGVRLASEKPFDLIILDIDLPGLDGLQVARTVRGMPMHLTTPIVFVTAYQPPEADLAGTGYNLLLQKPIFVASLKRAITALLDRPNQPASTRS